MFSSRSHSRERLHGHPPLTVSAAVGSKPSCCIEFDTRCICAALTNRLTKIGHLTVNRVLDFHDDYKAISSAPINHAVPESTKASAATYRLECNMIKHSTDGLLFFDGGRELRIVAYDVSRTNAVVHADGLGLLPISFYVTFDDFLTVGKCQLAWRYRDDIGVVFERWLDIRHRIAVDQAGAGDCGDHRHK
jgi:hypothetical protein